MMARKPKNKINAQLHYQSRVRPEISQAPWIFRVTELKEKPVPVFIVKERIHPAQRTDTNDLVAPRSVLRPRGLLYGARQLRCLPVIRAILSRICNEEGIPLELSQYLNGRRIEFRGNLPLDSEAGYKLALMFKLQERIKELDRVELMARRIDRFTREEAGYWYSRISTFGDAANRWATAGMKIMLSGHPRDPNIASMLEALRHRN
ncbi:MAG: hypothetical protein JRJ04_07295 [Deltaproteobacteria bacterium]|nr:hypothetical protein [Deltaproteobacteria bacterium]